MKTKYIDQLRQCWKWSPASYAAGMMMCVSLKEGKDWWVSLTAVVLVFVVSAALHAFLNWICCLVTPLSSKFSE